VEQGACRLLILARERDGASVEVLLSRAACEGYKREEIDAGGHLSGMHARVPSAPGPNTHTLHVRVKLH